MFRNIYRYNDYDLINNKKEKDMTLKIKYIGIDTGRRPTVYLYEDSSIVSTEGFSCLSRVKISNNKGGVAYATLNLVTDETLVKKDEVGVSKKVLDQLKAVDGDVCEIKQMEPLLSFGHIRHKLRGKPFTEDSILEVLKDVVAGKYTDTHMACLCAATESTQLSVDEIVYFARAMVKTGDVVKWDRDIVVDKHCIGGVPGNRTTPISIAIVAEHGLCIPKTSSRAITSPAGTADVMEAITNINISTEEMKTIVNKAGGCLIWGGSVDLNPSDDIIINVKKDLDLDSKGQMMASILSKKIAAGSTHVLIDIPYGPHAKTKTKDTAYELKRDFEAIGEKLGIKVVVEMSDGSQPIGNGIGPVLEAIDIIKVLKNEKDAPEDLREKALYLSGIIIEFDQKVAKGDGLTIAKDILDSGRAWERFKKICEAQGGLKKLEPAKLTHDILAKRGGIVREFDNKKLSNVAKLAGCPSHFGAGIFLYKHVSDWIKEGEKLYTIYSNSPGEMKVAAEFAEKYEIIKIE
ncbi:MAG: thymidine phosphorylase family protein [Rickettsiales bacterium]|nr:thymidine phosphorylase family protein [Rickettsiales bacterium]